MPLEVQQPITIPFKRGLLLQGAAIFGAMGGILLYFMIAEFPGSAKRVDMGTWIGFALGCLFVLLFLPLTTYLLYRSLSNKPFMVIDTTGLHRFDLSGQTHVPWSEVHSFQTSHEANGSVVHIIMRNPDAFVAKQGLIYRLFHGTGSTGGRMRLHTRGHVFDLAQVEDVLNRGIALGNQQTPAERS